MNGKQHGEWMDREDDEKMKKALMALSLTFVLIGNLHGQRADFDLLIRNGRIVDGTGNPSFMGDVGVREGKIISIGKLVNRSASRTIDATGLVVAPGFIDIHNHSDNTIVEDGDAQSMVRQGVTSMILGEGSSAAPSERWKDFSSYFAELKRRGISTNIGSYIGSGLVWTTVHGSRDASGSYEYYHADGLGSTRQLSNDTQTITQTTTFDAFGNIESSAGSSNAYKYAGQWGYRSDGDERFHKLAHSPNFSYTFAFNSSKNSRVLNC
jgi:hypothetical protein